MLVWVPSYDMHGKGRRMTTAEYKLLKVQDALRSLGYMTFYDGDATRIQGQYKAWQEVISYRPISRSREYVDGPLFEFENLHPWSMQVCHMGYTWAACTNRRFSDENIDELLDLLWLTIPTSNTSWELHQVKQDMSGKPSYTVGMILVDGVPYPYSSGLEPLV